MSVLISSHPKTGRTWLLFVLQHYVRMIEKQNYNTLTHRDLAWLRDNEKRVQATHLPYSGKKVKGYDKNAPKYYAQFKKIIYMMRKPHDTMISYYEYLKNRDPPFNILLRQFSPIVIRKFMMLEGFTKYFLPKYIDHVKSTKHRADLVLNYEDLRKDTMGFDDAIKLMCKELHLPYKKEVAKKAIEMSSFENIRQMGINTRQENGLAVGFRGHFCRNGTCGQYKKIMSKELIDYITERWNGIT